MKLLSMRLVIGLLLSGCTINSFPPSSPTVDYVSSQKTTIPPEGIELVPQEELIPQAPTTVVMGNTKIHPNCAPYKPLPVPEPAKIDFKELEAASTAKEINAITLRNIKALRDQMLGYRASQQKHYAEYVRRCVVK